MPRPGRVPNSPAAGRLERGAGARHVSMPLGANTPASGAFGQPHLRRPVPMCTGISGRGADQGLLLDSVRAIAYARRAVEIGDRSDSLVVSDALSGNARGNRSSARGTSGRSPSDVKTAARPSGGSRRRTRGGRYAVRRGPGHLRSARARGSEAQAVGSRTQRSGRRRSGRNGDWRSSRSRSADPARDRTTVDEAPARCRARLVRLLRWDR